MTVFARRALLAGGAVVTGAALLAWLGRGLRAVRPAPALLEVVPGSPALRLPATVGAPEPAVEAALWGLFVRIAARWEMTGQVDLDEPGFREILRLRSAGAPSYLTEYREAARLLGELAPAPADGAGHDGFDQLFARPVGVADFALTRLGRLQSYVVGEFLELQVAFGGFRAFGYRNYRGFAGGPLSDPARLPYAPADRG